jgi:hypothetical protein
MFIGYLFVLLRGESEKQPAESLLVKYTAPEAVESNYRPLLSRADARSDPKRIFAARPQVQKQLAERNQHQSIFLKTHSAVVQYEGAPQINSEVTRGAIYVVRNPLDVACSFAPYFGTSIDEAIRRMGTTDFHIDSVDAYFAELTGSWSVNVGSWTTTADIPTLVLRYEDLLSDPIRAFKAFVRHAAIPAPPPLIRRAANLSSFASLREQEAKGSFPSLRASSGQFFRAGKAGQWRRTLSTAQVDRIAADHEEQMKRFGYLP